MKPANLFTTIIALPLPQTSQTLDELLQFIERVDFFDRALESLTTLRAQRGPRGVKEQSKLLGGFDSKENASTPSTLSGLQKESPFERRQREEREDSLIVLTREMIEKCAKILSDSRRAYELGAVCDAINCEKRPHKSDIDLGEVRRVTAGIGAELSAVELAENAIMSRVAAFDDLRKELAKTATSTVDPSSLSEEHFQSIVSKKMRAEAMIRHIKELAKGFAKEVASLVPLIQEGLYLRLELAETVRRGLAELKATSEKGKCLFESRQDAYRKTKIADLLRMSERDVQFVRNLTTTDTVFDDAKRVAAALSDELSMLVAQTEEVVKSLGSDIPSIAEFTGTQCRCGCGEDNTRVGLVNGGVRTTFLIP